MAILRAANHPCGYWAELFRLGVPDELSQHVGCSMTVLARLLRLWPEGKMDEARWAFHRINWTLYRDAEGLWMAFSSACDSHSTLEKRT